MTEPITRLGKQEKFLRTIRKTLSREYGISEYSLEIKIVGGATRIEIIILADQEGGES